MVSFDRFMAIKVWKSFSWLSTFQKSKIKWFSWFLRVFGASENRLFWTYFRCEFGPNRHFTPFLGKTSSSSAKIAKSTRPDCVYLSFPKNSCNLEYFCTFLRFLTPKTDVTFSSLLMSQTVIGKEPNNIEKLNCLVLKSSKVQFIRAFHKLCSPWTDLPKIRRV